MPIIEKCEVFGKEWDYSSFVQYLNSLSKEDQEQFLLSILDQYGYRSKEFIFALQGIVYWCIGKYGMQLGEDIEDVVSSCIAKVLEGMTEFDRSKGRLTSYLHTICRGVITCYNSRQRTLKKYLSDCSLVGIDAVTEVNGLSNVLQKEVEDRLNLYTEVFGFGREEAYRMALWDFFVKYGEGKLSDESVNVALFVLSKMMRIPFMVLKSIHSRCGDDVLFVFYLFAGKSVKFPNLSKLYKVVKFSQDFVRRYGIEGFCEGREDLMRFLEEVLGEGGDRQTS